MSYSKIRQSKISDVIEQQLESLIFEGTLRPGEKLLSERELAKKFEVSRPSLREAISRLEMKGLVLRRQGGGTYIKSELWQSLTDPLTELISDNSESQLDLLETCHALEGVAAYFAALRGTDEDFQRIKDCHQRILKQNLSCEQEAEAVIQYLIAVTEASHNAVLLHLVRCMVPILQQNIHQILELLCTRPEISDVVNQHRLGIMLAVIARQPEKARDASHSHLAYIEDVLLDLNQEMTRRERSLRRLQQRKN